MPEILEPRGGLYYGWALGESGWNVRMDENLKRLGRFAFHLSVKDRDLATPPGSPAAGDTYIVAATATDAWLGKEGQVAIWSGTAWVFGIPREGWHATIEDEGVLSVYTLGTWSAGVNPSTLGRLVKSITGGTVALTAAEARNDALEFTGALTSNATIEVPAAPKLFTVYNNTTGSWMFNIKTAAGTGVYITQGARALLYCDGTNVVRVGPDMMSDGGITLAGVLDLWEALNLNDHLLTRPELRDVAETRATPASSAGAITLDLQDGNVAETTLGESITTLTISNPPASGKSGKLRWIIHQDATGGRTVTWPASVKWGTAGAPTLSTAANAVDIIDFETTDGGATWWARVYGLGY